jgi:VIT1/CCC1 family predicted Fe2+/Mn2+ transporter
MKHSLKTGLAFGLTSAIITTLGLIVGLHSFAGSKAVIMGGILTIAIADAFSDALGIHISEESEAIHADKEIWESTLTTFVTKFLFALTFLIPVFVFDLSTSILVSVVWGLLILTILCVFIAKEQNKKRLNIVIEHLAIALIVIVITHSIGDWIAVTFL